MNTKQAGEFMPTILMRVSLTQPIKLKGTKSSHSIPGVHGELEFDGILELYICFCMFVAEERA